jgi:hypothetical protein
MKCKNERVFGWMMDWWKYGTPPPSHTPLQRINIPPPSANPCSKWQTMCCVCMSFAVGVELHRHKKSYIYIYINSFYAAAPINISSFSLTEVLQFTDVTGSHKTSRPDQETQETFSITSDETVKWYKACVCVCGGGGGHIGDRRKYLSYKDE